MTDPVEQANELTQQNGFAHGGLVSRCADNALTVTAGDR